MGLLRIKLDADLDPAALAGDAALLARPFRYARSGRGVTPVVATAALADMPGATALEILLPAAAVRFVRTKVPRVTGLALRRVLPNLVEDGVVGEVSECHLALLPGAPADGKRSIAVVGRDWMRLVQRIAQLRKARRVVAVSEVMLAPAAPFLCIEAGRGYLKHGLGVLPFIVPADGSLPPELRLARPLLGQTALATGGSAPDLARRWSEALGVSLVPGTWSWAEAPPVDAAWSLLQHEYARGSATGAGRWRAWRMPLALGAACLMAGVAGLDLHWWQLARERRVLEARVLADFRTAFPAITVIVDPIGQARRQLAVAAGGRDDPYFVLTGALAQALPPPTDGAVPVRALEYRAGSLKARLAPGTDAGRIAQRMRSAEIDAQAEAPGTDGAPVIVLRRKAA